MRKAVAYIRVSTSEQGSSGLGLDAQRNAIEHFARHHSYEIEPENWFQEVASGTGADALIRRPILAEAIKRARRLKGILIVAKLDRLSRSTVFVAGLLDDKRIRFRAADLGDEADNTFLRMLAVFAEREREQISRRTSEALQAAARRGVILGNPTNLREAAQRGAATNAQRAADFASDVLPRIERARSAGAKTFREIAQALTDLGVPTARGGDWHPEGVRRLLERAENETTQTPRTPSPRAPRRSQRSHTQALTVINEGHSSPITRPVRRLRIDDIQSPDRASS